MENNGAESREVEREAHASIEMVNIDIESQDIETEDNVSINIELPLPHDPVVISIRGMLESLSPLSSRCCIYRVPEKLRKVSGEAYTPRVVSIGPLHHGEKGLQAMEEHKLRYLQSFLGRTRLSLEDYVKVVRRWEKRARCCYAETIELSRDEFVKIILVDGSFIVELLLRSSFPELIDESDRVYFKPRLVDDVWRDMALLENQLPFFVLAGIVGIVDKLSIFNQGVDLSIIKLTHEFFKSFVKMDNLPRIKSSHEVKHFVDFLRFYYLPSSPSVWKNGNATDGISPSATELHEAGVKFMKGTSSSLLDINFTNENLEIPHFVIDDLTETLFRNLIAFEQCHGTEKYIIHYMCFMDSMINTPKDVHLLIRHGIITSQLGNNEDVSTLFNNISKEVIFGHTFYFSSLCKNLNVYCRTPWHKWKATLRRDYFNTPWAVISIIAAIILLIFTFIQAVCSIISL